MSKSERGEGSEEKRVSGIEWKEEKSKIEETRGVQEKEKCVERGEIEKTVVREKARETKVKMTWRKKRNEKNKRRKQ